MKKCWNFKSSADHILTPEDHGFNVGTNALKQLKLDVQFTDEYQTFCI